MYFKVIRFLICLVIVVLAGVIIWLKFRPAEEKIEVSEGKIKRLKRLSDYAPQSFTGKCLCLIQSTAMHLRDECEAGNLTVDEYTQWMEDYFPNRKKNSVGK